MPDDDFSPKKIALSHFQSSPLTVIGENSPIEICDENQAPLFYCLSQQDYNELIERVRDAELAAIVLERRQKKLDELDLD